ncbi:CBASS cGAMP-activated phospholipase [Cupriavidus plantarum]|uniref:CBASS cGAMP-activated phospholipase n=1 Tax=Cupriavidus plantarum TaxID=942865 RepID=UPI001B0BC2EC|nr:CBASS cGAMP-activated phospholipase [Cupriavidus plantarum]CAG2145549.1 cGAMP-activated phospholipase [Cupriavidus plantarum]SMR86745.1 Patatin-like phospholipase [Cupriavidus plantarum]
MEWTKEQPFQALALTGGGYRGLFTARVLQKIEEHHKKPIATCFDLVSGTSIGGIIALAAAFEIPMSRVVEVFCEDGETIFPFHEKPTTIRGQVWDFLRHLRRPRYAASNLRDTIAKLIPEDTLLGEALHPVAIPAVNVTMGEPQVFKTRHKETWTRDCKFKVVDIALATAAAPTFFELAEVESNVYADGGLFANAPDLVAMHEAEHYFGVPKENFRLLSIGTTTRNYSIARSLGRQFGVSDWMAGQRLFSVIISAQQQFVEQIVRHRLEDRYLRIDHVAGDEQAGDLGLDVATEAAKKTLLGLADKHASNVMGDKLPLFLSHLPQLQLFKGEK